MLRGTLVVVIAVVVALLLWPEQVDGLIPLVAYSLPFSAPAQHAVLVALGLLLNVALFVPVGAIVGLVTKQFWLGCFIGFAMSAVLEAAQAFLPSRNADPVDVICNSVGAAVGALIARSVLKRRGRAIS